MKYNIYNIVSRESNYNPEAFNEKLCAMQAFILTG